MRTACEVCQITMIIPPTDVALCDRCCDEILEASKYRQIPNKDTITYRGHKITQLPMVHPSGRHQP